MYNRINPRLFHKIQYQGGLQLNSCWDKMKLNQKTGRILELYLFYLKFPEK